MMPCAIFKKDTDMEKQNFSMWVPSSQKICGVSRGAQPLGSGFPIGASSIPVGTRFSAGKSSVLYLCFRLTLERGWLRHLLYGQIAVDRHFSATVGQADFVRPRTKSRFAQRAESACPEKEAEVYQSPCPAAAKRTNTTMAVPARDYPAPTPPLTLHGSR